MPSLRRISHQNTHLNEDLHKPQKESTTTSNPQSSSLPNPSPIEAIISATLKLDIEPPPYTYKPLAGERNIRVLEVHGADSYDTVLSFKLLEICLDSPPEYYAISYCWEGQTPSQRVLCEGQTLLVTANCEAALKQFRRQQSESILLWIDAICINQAAESVLERNHQVLMMGDVYATATQVKVWLGTDRLEPLSSKALAMLKYLQKLVEVVCKNSTEDEIFKTALEMKANDLTRIRSHMSWFRRIWVVQEVFLSKDAVIHRDGIMIDYRGLIRAITTLINSSKRNPNLLPHKRLLGSSLKMFRALESPNASLDATHIFISARNFRCTDPRDKVFALHSIFSAAGLTLPHPDYTKDTPTVYRKAMRAILLHDESLEALRYLHGLDHTSKLSSWSVDLSQRRFPCNLNQTKFKASCKSSLAISFLNNDKLFLCRGRILEVVSMCAGVAMPHSERETEAPNKYLTWSLNLQPTEEAWIGFLEIAPELSRFVLRVWAVHVLRKFLLFVSSKCPSNRTQADVYQELQDCIMSYVQAYSRAFSHVGKIGDWDEWRRGIMEEHLCESPTLNPVSPPDIPISATEEGKNTIDWAAHEQLAYLRSIQRKLRDSKVSSVLQTSEFKTLERISLNRSQAALHYVISSAIGYQTIFQTNSSNSLGMAPHSVREGDQVALLAGLNVPMIIRPLENGHFQMIAPAYIYGMMEGQAWDKAWEADVGKLLQELIFE